MLTLAIDCSARLCAVALHSRDGDRILAEAAPEIGRGHAERLPGILQTVLDAAGRDLSDVGRVGVTIGPGSFAGIRVGVAFARGLALSLGVPSVGVGTLEAMAGPAARARNRAVLAVLDARRERVWSLLVNADGRIGAPGAELTPETSAIRARESDCVLIGSGAHLLVRCDPTLAQRVIGDDPSPAITEVARLAASLPPAENPANPRYLREADAKPQTGFALPHKVD